ncbi:hypothetical protein DFJ77DRAFT_548108, partial [Powellomyces hirtus]
MAPDRVKLSCTGNTSQKLAVSMTGRSRLRFAVIGTFAAACTVSSVQAQGVTWPSGTCTPGYTYVCTSSTAVTISSSTNYTNCSFRGCPQLIVSAPAGTTITFLNVTVDGTGVVTPRTTNANIYVYGGASVVATNSIFQSLYTTGTSASNFGGAFYINAGRFTATNSTFLSNKALIGSAIAARAGAVVSLTNCNFTSNEGVSGSIDTTYGGAIYMETSTIAIVDTTFANNSVGNSGGGSVSARRAGNGHECVLLDEHRSIRWLDLHYGGAVVVQKGPIFNWTNGSCIGVSAGLKGGCVYVVSDPATTVGTAAYLSGVVFRDSSGISGQIFTTGYNSSVTANDITVTNVTITGSGSAYSGNGGNVAFTNCLFSYLTAVSGAVAGVTGDNIANQATAVVLFQNSTITNVSAGVGGAFYVARLATISLVNVTIQNATSTSQSGPNGGGVVDIETGAKFTMTNTTITGAISGLDGGVVRVATGSTVQNPSSFGCYGVSIMTGYARRNGGCIYNSASIVEVADNCGLVSCYATASGGGIYNVARGNATIRGNSTISLSVANTFGGGIALNGPGANVRLASSAVVRNNTAVICGGGIDSTSDSYAVDYSTIKWNTAPCGPAACLRNTTAQDSSGSLLVDSTATVIGAIELMDSNNVCKRDSNSTTSSISSTPVTTSSSSSIIIISSSVSTVSWYPITTSSSEVPSSTDLSSSITSSSTTNSVSPITTSSSEVSSSTDLSSSITSSSTTNSVSPTTTSSSEIPSSTDSWSSITSSSTTDSFSPTTTSSSEVPSSTDPWSSITSSSTTDSLSATTTSSSEVPSSTDPSSSITSTTDSSSPTTTSSSEVSSSTDPSSSITSTTDSSSLTTTSSNEVSRSTDPSSSVTSSSTIDSLSPTSSTDSSAVPTSTASSSPTTTSSSEVPSSTDPSSSITSTTDSSSLTTTSSSEISSSTDPSSSVTSSSTIDSLSPTSSTDSSAVLTSADSLSPTTTSSSSEVPSSTDPSSSITSSSTTNTLSPTSTTVSADPILTDSLFTTSSSSSSSEVLTSTDLLSSNMNSSTTDSLSLTSSTDSAVPTSA